MAVGFPQLFSTFVFQSPTRLSVAWIVDVSHSHTSIRRKINHVVAVGYSLRFKAFSLSNQDPYIPQPPAQVLEKLPPQPLTADQRLAMLASFHWELRNSVIQMCSVPGWESKDWCHEVFFDLWFSVKKTDNVYVQLKRFLVMFTFYIFYNLQEESSWPSSTWKEKRVTAMFVLDLLSCLPLGRSGSGYFDRKKKAKVKQPKWREYFYGNLPVTWNQAGIWCGSDMIGVVVGDVTSEEVCGHGRNKDPGSSSIEVAATHDGLVKTGVLINGQVLWNRRLIMKHQWSSLIIIPPVFWWSHTFLTTSRPYATGIPPQIQWLGKRPDPPRPEIPAMWSGSRVEATKVGPRSTTELKSPMIFVMKSLSWCFDSGLRQVDSKVAMLKHWPQISQLAQVLIFDSSISIFPHWRDMQSVHKSEIHEGFLLFPWCVSQETTWVGTFIRDQFGKFHRASSQGTWMITLDGIATRWGRARVSRVTRTLHFAYCLPLCSHKQWIRLQVVGCCDYSLSCATENRFVETLGIRSLTRAKDEPLKAPLCPHSEEAIRHWMVCLPSTDSIWIFKMVPCCES